MSAWSDLYMTRQEVGTTYDEDHMRPPGQLQLDPEFNWRSTNNSPSLGDNIYYLGKETVWSSITDPIGRVRREKCDWKAHFCAGVTGHRIVWLSVSVKENK
jgi:hypothetical protein